MTEVHGFHLPELESRGVEFRLDLPEGDAPVEIDADPGQLRQVLTNLIRNAAEVFGAGDDGVVTFGLRQKEGRALLTVQDNGPGMAAAVMGRVFEPFFSKKRGGTGLGLAISQNLIEKHGGEIRVESTEGAGTLFEVALPLPPAA